MGGLSSSLFLNNFNTTFSLTWLTINSFNGVEALPEWLGNLAFLWILIISGYENLKYLPSLKTMQRLTKLEVLRIFGCPLLKERCRKDSGEEWPKVFHIPTFQCKKKVSCLIEPMQCLSNGFSSKCTIESVAVWESCVVQV
ncbi:putative leucine-rich repeat domain, L domain-containing protein [Rosa chinensis]|uniref:Putative leucine-rich repeat domain, L domain-containing protein n=1 Tax=Rosa chinensis TaxID=74649 RepID=A0A2P6QWB1_ROSCH|nr:putative leucine-rich repeat domain, L domain-containing protein [Rosa chinensis]